MTGTRHAGPSTAAGEGDGRSRGSQPVPATAAEHLVDVPAARI